MDLRVWSKVSSDYGRKLLDSGIEGAHSGEEAFLDGKPLTPFLNESVCSAVTPAVLGAFIGVLSSYRGHQRKSVTRTLAYGLLGGAIGLSAGLLGLSIAPTVLWIGIQAFGAAQIGFRVGSRIGDEIRERAEWVAGAALIVVAIVLLVLRVARL